MSALNHVVSGQAQGKSEVQSPASTGKGFQEHSDVMLDVKKLSLRFCLAMAFQNGLTCYKAASYDGEDSQVLRPGSEIVFLCRSTRLHQFRPSIKA